MYRYVAILLVLMLPALAPAQQVTGTITGSVIDSSGSTVSGAAVTLVSEQTGAVRTATTDNSGSFVFSAVNPGMYTVSAEMAGFKKMQKQGLELAPGGTLAAGQLRLEVGNVTESVTVKAEGALVQTGSSERSGIITSDEICCRSSENVVF
jgi:hypothetical protein